MALSGTIDNKLTSWLTLRIKWVVNSQSVANNTSNVTATVQLISGNGNTSIGSRTITLNINGTEYTGTSGLSINKNTTKTLLTKTVNVAHNSDGTKTCAFSCSVPFNATISGVNWTTKTASGSGTFNTIPRASAFGTVSGNTIGSTMTVNITRNSTAFTHQLWYKVGNSSWYDLGKGITTSKAFTIDSATCSQFPNATSGTLQLCLRTYNGTTQIGADVYKNITVSVPAYVVPIISAFTLTEANEAIKGKFSAFVNKQSKIAFNVTAAGAIGSTIKSCVVSIVGQKFTKSSGTTAQIAANYAGTHTAVVAVTDSRGRMSTKNVSFTVFEYSPPKFTAFSAQRCNADGTLNDDGEYLSLTVGSDVAAVNNENTVAYALYYKKTNDSEYTKLAFSGSGYSYNGTTVFTSPTFSVDNSYIIRFQITDAITTITRNETLSSAKPILDILPDGSGMAAGKVAEKSGVFDFGFTVKAGEGFLHPTLLENTDLNEVIEPNTYTSIDKNATTYLNCPITYGTFTLDVASAGDEGQIVQTITSTSKYAFRVWKRFYHSTDGVKSWGEWRQIYTAAGNVLWSGGMYMQASHTITLSEAISKQPTGIELVFSRYESGAALDDDFSHHFVSKKSVAMHNNKGHSFIMSDAFFRNVGAKYLIITDTVISGFASNVEVSTASGITFDNKKWVLRYVIGV